MDAWHKESAQENYIVRSMIISNLKVTILHLNVSLLLAAFNSLHFLKEGEEGAKQAALIVMKNSHSYRTLRYVEKISLKTGLSLSKILIEFESDNSLYACKGIPISVKWEGNTSKLSSMYFVTYTTRTFVEQALLQGTARCIGMCIFS